MMKERTLIISTKSILFLLWAAVVLYVSVGNATETPFSVDATQRRSLLAVTPQGWGFFTRDPREPTTRAYALHDGEWRRVDRENASVSNWFGLSRNGRAVGIEMSSLTSQMADADWRDCTGDLLRCLADASARPLSNRASRPVLCGEIALVRREPVPWAWARSRHPVTMPAKFTRIRASCT